MSKYKYILFDADNTLFDFDKCEKEAFKEAFGISGLSYSDEIYEEYHIINNGLWKLLEKGGIERSKLKTERYRLLFEKFGVTDNSYIEVAKRYEQCLGMQTFEIEGVFELLTGLSRDFQIYVITNGLTSIQESRFSRSRITPLVKDVFISEKVGFAKPDKRYFDYVVSHVGDTDISKYIVVGDSLTSDIDGAIAYGIDCCWYNRSGASSNGRLPTYEITDIMAVKTIL
jgi:YjjG family noncanonical pyrimidine nucleotidase